VEGNEISLIDILKSEGNDIVDEIHSNMELEQIKKYIDVLDEREKEVIISRFGLDMQREKHSVKSRKNSAFPEAMYCELKSAH
jgi:RNA polymerase sporulation-specific sigma factor